MGQQSSMPEQPERAERGREVTPFASDPVPGHDDGDSMVKTEGPEWPSTAPAVLPSAHADLPGNIPVSPDAEGAAPKKPKKAKRKRERSSNSLFTQSQSQSQREEASLELPQYTEPSNEQDHFNEDRSGEAKSKLSRQGKRKRTRKGSPTEQEVKPLGVQSPSIPSDETDDAPQPVIPAKRKTDESHSGGKRRKRRRSSGNESPQNETRIGEVDESHDMVAANTCRQSPSPELGEHGSTQNGQVDAAYMDIDIDDPLLEEEDVAPESVSQDGAFEQPDALEANGVHDEEPPVVGSLVNGVSQEEEPHERLGWGLPDIDQASDVDAEMKEATASVNFENVAEASDRSRREQSEEEAVHEEDSASVSSGEQKLGPKPEPELPARNTALADEVAEESSESVEINNDADEESDSASGAPHEAVDQAISRTLQTDRAAQDPAVNTDANETDNIVPEAGQKQLTEEQDLDGGVSDADLEAALERITTPLAKAVDKTPKIKSSGTQRAKPSFFDNMYSSAAIKTPKSAKPPVTSTKKLAPLRQSQAFATPSRQNIAAFSQLPLEAAVATTPRSKGQPRKLILGADPVPSSSPAKSKMSSQMRGGQGGDGPPSSGPGSNTAQRPAQKKAGLLSGPFSEAELDQIAAGVESFRRSCGMSQFEVNMMVQEAPKGASALHKELWQHVTAACPSRSRQKVINRTRKIFHNFVGRGKWTAEQDEELQAMVAKHGTKWSLIAGLINRHQEDVRDRWINFLINTERRVDYWKPEEEAQLVEIAVSMLKEIQKSRAEDLNAISTTSEADIPWDNVSAEMGRTRSARQCRQKWKQLRRMNRLQDNGEDIDIILAPIEPVESLLYQARGNLRRMGFEDKLQLIQAIREAGVKKETNIPWSTLVDAEYRRRWSISTLKLLWARLRKTVPGHETKSVRRVASILLREYEAHKQFANILDMDFDDGEESKLMDTPKRRITHRQSREWKRPMSSVHVHKDNEDEPVSEDEHDGEDEIPTSAQKPANDSSEEEEIPASPTSNEVVCKPERVEEMDVDEDDAGSEDGREPNGSSRRVRSESVDLGTANDNNNTQSEFAVSSPTPHPRSPKKSALKEKRREKRKDSDGSSVNAESFKLKRKRPGLVYGKSPSSAKSNKKSKKSRRKLLTVSQDEIEDDSEAERKRRAAVESDEDDDMEDIPARVPKGGTADED